MKYLSIFILTLTFIQKSVFSQTADTKKISNKQFTFGYNIHDWLRASEIELQNKIRTDSDLSKREINYLYYFYDKSEKINERSFFIIQKFDVNENSYAEFKMRFKSIGSKVIIENNDKIIKDFTKSLKIGEFICDDINQVIYFSSNVDLIDGRKLTSLSTIYFSNKNIVQFNFASPSSEYSKNVTIFQDVLDSFRWVNK